MNDTAKLPVAALLTKTYEYEFHPLSEIFPLIEGAEFEALVEDIRARGIIVPIVLHEGKILDGRNRYRAGKRADHPFSDRDFVALRPGLDPEGFVYSANAARRQMNQKQKREYISKLLLKHPDWSDRDIAKLGCVDKKTVASVREEERKKVEALKEKFEALHPTQQREFIAQIAKPAKRLLSELAIQPS